jgi:hypothetical protein
MADVNGRQVHEEGALTEKNAAEPPPNKIKIVTFGHFGLTEGPQYPCVAYAKRRLADELLDANLRRAKHLRTDPVPLARGAKL